MTEGSRVFQSILALLSEVDLPDSVFLPHYFRVVSSLGEPKLAEAQGLTGIVRELSSLQDGARGDIPNGLLQFLVRLSTDDRLTKAIEKWLEKHATPQRSALATIRQQLDVENQTKILVVETETGETGEVEAFEAFMRTRTLAPVAVELPPRQEVAGWDDFQAKLLSIVTRLRAQPLLRDFEIHVLADPPLFDHPFHRIPLASGVLGEDFVVVLRHRERVLEASARVLDAWRQFAGELRRKTPRQIKVLKTGRATGSGEILPRGKGFCYAPFALPPSPSTATANPNEKRAILRLLRLGVPYLYWSHEALVDDDKAWRTLEKTFRRWLKDVKSLDRFPDAFTQQRIAGNAFACNGTLLWDDPEFRPFVTTPGVKQQ